MEAQAFVLHCTTAISDKGIELMGTAGSPVMGSEIIGSSAVFGPDGRTISASKSTNEQLLFADLDMDLVIKAKTFADASGHCMQHPFNVVSLVEQERRNTDPVSTDSRPDMLWLGADRSSKKVVRHHQKEMDGQY